MGQKVIYWVVTGLVALAAVFAGVNYLRGSQQAVQGFAHVGYPQQLRVLLGIAKLLGGITLLVPGLLRLKEWAYAGFTFAWLAVVIAHYLAKDGACSLLSAHTADPSVCLIFYPSGPHSPTPYCPTDIRKAAR